MSKPTMQEFERSSYLAGANADYIEQLYELFLQNPESVDEQWRSFFHSLANGAGASDVAHSVIREEFRQLAKRPMSVHVDAQPKQVAVDLLVEAYRRFGHLNADTNPLAKNQDEDVRLSLHHHQLSSADLATLFDTKGILPKPQASLQEIYQQLRRVYCGKIGVQYSTISNEEERHWLRDYVEQRLPSQVVANTQKIHILRKLIASEALEKYLDVKYIGQKRFSIEGADSLIPLLDTLARCARQHQVNEIVMGMAHRGRLNVLMNIFGKSPNELFQEFEGKKDYGMTTGDVKYHLGYSCDMKTEHGPIHLSLAFNPSHLAYINPVVMGSVRARQQLHADTSRNHALAIIMHGDAAFSGQGVVMESLSMSQTRAYHIGGSIHIIINNQIGFTTSNRHDARSSYYSSDLAKMLDAPVFHVNGDDPEAVVAVAQLALEYRMKFHKDIFIDLVCYRRHGHQEVDEPTTTQPLMYQTIKHHPTTMTTYAKQLIDKKLVEQAQIDHWVDEYRDNMDEGHQVVEIESQGLSQRYAANWTPYLNSEPSLVIDTAVSRQVIDRLGKVISTYPEDFKLQRQVSMIMEQRKKMAAGEKPLDWGYAETMAYATLLDQGHSVRLTGEDSRRGTFYHRHATLFNQTDGKEYMPLLNISPTQAKLEIYDSLLSESGPMGFEYGYSTSHPDCLTIWEAQFGDFANVAQVVIDQFISSGWEKWGRLSGLTLFLPHGYEGMGAEHSSARLERYLQLSAQYNMQIFIPTTPSQIFHLLRRQVIRPVRKPLVVFTPKSLLRHKLAISSLDDLAHGQLSLIIPEVDQLNNNHVKRVVLCSGRIYYDILEQRRKEEIDNIAIIRIEQLYPFPYEELTQLLKQYPNAREVIWCQEEPMNQGAWFCTRHRLLKSLLPGQELHYAGRRAAAAPAVGYPALHYKQQTQLVNEALGLTQLTED